MNIDYRQIGSRIKIKRKEKGLTQEKLAELLDVSVGYVSQLERGVTKISLDTLGAISGVLECDVTYFIAHSTVASVDYLCNEFTEQFRDLTQAQRLIVLDVIDVLKKHL